MRLPDVDRSHQPRTTSELFQTVTDASSRGLFQYAFNEPPKFSRHSGWTNGVGIPAKTRGITNHSRLRFGG